MTPLHDITAVILAGGLGSRLRDVVSDRPKVLAEVNGRPFLDYLLGQLSQSGIRSAVLCTGYLADQIEERFGRTHNGMRLDYSVETAPLGTAGALRLALPLLKGDTFVLLNGDSFCALDFGAFLRFHAEKKARLSLCLTRVPDVSRYGAVQQGPDRTIGAFEEKGAACGTGLINAGVYLVERSVVEGIPPGGAVSLEKEIIPGMVGAGLFGFPSGGRFIDIGVPADYRAAQQFFADED